MCSIPDRLPFGLNVILKHIFNLFPILIITSEKPLNTQGIKHLSNLLHKHQVLCPHLLLLQITWVSLAITANQLNPINQPH